jgi:hypothetical protein
MIRKVNEKFPTKVKKVEPASSSKEETEDSNSEKKNTKG